MIGEYVVLWGEGKVVKILDKLRDGGSNRYLCEVLTGEVNNKKKGEFVQITPCAIKGFAKEWERQQAEKYFNQK